MNQVKYFLTLLVLTIVVLLSSNDDYLYFIANQLHRQPSFHNGEDLRKKPYSLFRVAVNAQPVSLK